VSPAADDPDWPTTARLGGASAGSAGESGAEPAPPTSAAPSVSSPQKSGGRRSARTPAPKSNPASKGNQASKGSRNAVPEPVGFDPGDEPLDDAPTGDSSGPRETAEEKVLRDLGQHFQVEKIGE
jgi:hypothetical protein